VGGFDEDGEFRNAGWAQPGRRGEEGGEGRSGGGGGGAVWCAGLAMAYG
jgi:hypothetical protein